MNNLPQAVPVYAPQQQAYYPSEAVVVPPQAVPQQYYQQPQQQVLYQASAPQPVQQKQAQPLPQQQVPYQQPHQAQPVYVQPVHYAPQPMQPLAFSAPITNGQWIEPGANGASMEPAIALIANFFFPGLGHLLIGQVNKAVFYIISMFVLSTVIGFLAAFLIGICLLPFLFIYQIIIAMDSYYMALRLRQGYPIMQGECSTSYATWFLNLAVTPVFVTGSNSAPTEWRHRMFQITGQAAPQTAQAPHNHDDENGRLVA